MILVERKQTNPYFNIAAEEYILKNLEDDVVMLWQSEPSVVVGKHQNAITEVNQKYLEENHIPVIRRISGGGTVFHDPGNLNFTVIRTEKRKDRFINFREFTQPIIEFLDSMDIEAIFEGKNNLTIDGKKFSGNSAHVFQNRVMHHGTLLFDSDLDRLNKAIQPSHLNVEDKSVQSIRATVTNINDHMKSDLSIDQFKDKYQNFLIDFYSITEKRKLTETDEYGINQLVKDRYNRWEWNFGYSPKYVFKNEIDGRKIIMKVKNGIIESADFEPGNMRIEKLLGCKHQKEALKERLNNMQLTNENIDSLLELFGY